MSTRVDSRERGAPRYVVNDEHTLGYIYETHPTMMGILHSSILRGGPYGLQGWIHIGQDRIRPATLTDFHAYRVSPRGHLKE